MIELCGILISELSDIGTLDSEELCSNALFLVSQPVDKEQSVSEYISRKIQYRQFKDKIDTDLSVSNIWNELTGIEQDMQKISQTSSTLFCNSRFPYILSSYTFRSGGLISAEGYPLYQGMAIEFGREYFERISVSSIISPTIMDGVTISNQIAHKDFVNSSIEHVAAYFITKKHEGEEVPSVFKTYHDLSSSNLSDLYYGTKRRNPTKNDYCVVLSDETQTETKYGDVPCTTRYLFTSVSCDEETYSPSMWTFQYIVNSSPFTDSQWKAINSEIRKETKITRTDDDTEGVGSQTVPVYADQYGIIHEITSYSGTSDKALKDSEGNTIKDTYLHLSGGMMTGQLCVTSINATEKITIGGIDISNVISGSISHESWTFQYENDSGELCSVTKNVYCY